MRQQEARLQPQPGDYLELNSVKNKHVILTSLVQMYLFLHYTTTLKATKFHNSPFFEKRSRLRPTLSLKSHSTPPLTTFSTVCGGAAGGVAI
jgi:hypothetical protein